LAKRNAPPTLMYETSRCCCSRRMPETESFKKAAASLTSINSTDESNVTASGSMGRKYFLCIRRFYRLIQNCKARECASIQIWVHSLRTTDTRGRAGGLTRGRAVFGRVSRQAARTFVRRGPTALPWPIDYLLAPAVAVKSRAFGAPLARLWGLTARRRQTKWPAMPLRHIRVRAVGLIRLSLKTRERFSENTRLSEVKTSRPVLRNTHASSRGSTLQVSSDVVIPAPDFMTIQFAAAANFRVCADFAIGATIRTVPVLLHRCFFHQSGPSFPEIWKIRSIIQGEVR
jgi:hypothetical protein